MKTAVDAEQIFAAADRIRPLVHRTPVLTSGSFNARTGLPSFFKCENLQRGGAFKIRGASNFLYSMTPEELRRGVVAYSSGNHAQAVAIAARALGAAATIVMPSDAPRAKLEATRGYGASVVTYDRLTENRERIGGRIAEQTGATLVPPFDHPWIIAGQGTAALELLQDAPDFDALVVPIGGGGLISGCAIVLRHLAPEVRIFGVEPELANDTWRSVAAGERVAIPPPETIADGLRAPQPGEITFPIIRELVDQVLLVSEEEIRETVRFLLTRMKILVEPSGAVAAAAVLFGKLPAGIGSVGIVLSGGNVDFEQLAAL